MHQTVPTFQETLPAFLRTLEGSNKSRATITAYRSDLAQFVAFLRETNCTVSTPADVTHEDVAEYLSDLADQGITEKSRARKLSTLREYFRFLEAGRPDREKSDAGDRDAEERTQRQDHAAPGRVHAALGFGWRQPPRLRDPPGLPPDRDPCRRTLRPHPCGHRPRGSVALVPASLLPYKAQWQRLANELPIGSVLIISPLAGPPETMLQKVSSHLRSHGRVVKTLPAAAAKAIAA